MSDTSIRSDYHFLEDVLTNIDGGKRLLKEVGAAQNEPHKQVDALAHPMMQLSRDDDDDEPQSKRPRTSRLVQKAADRGVTLLQMPTGMERHKSNSSWYHAKTDTFYWKVDFLIHAASQTSVLSIPKLSEHANLSEELAKALLPDVSNSTHHLLVKRLPCRSNSPSYVELDRKSSTLHTALQNMTVIEYPTIEVVPRGLLDRFPLHIQEIKSEMRDEANQLKLTHLTTIRTKTEQR
jgi:hypothetical protein